MVGAAIVDACSKTEFRKDFPSENLLITIAVYIRAIAASSFVSTHAVSLEYVSKNMNVDFGGAYKEVPLPLPPPPPFPLESKIMLDAIVCPND
jgi:hypothetical protein